MSIKIAIIPARGGSKRIPNKNIKLFAGQPIISYSIRVAQETKMFNKIIVSTDSLEIAKVAKEYGAEVPFLRPAELANDFANTDEVMYHSLDWLAKEGMQPEYFCCIYATAPFIQARFLKLGYEKLVSYGVASVFSVTTYPYPIFRSLKITKKGFIEMIWPEYTNFRSQDLPEAYHDAGQFYWANTNKFLKSKTLFAEDSLPLILPRYFVQDIDTMEDWEIAEMLFPAIKIKMESKNI
jgi:pseudaminic acid cytidylyltransferase